MALIREGTYHDAAGNIAQVRLVRGRYVLEVEAANGDEIGTWEFNEAGYQIGQEPQVVEAAPSEPNISVDIEEPTRTGDDGDLSEDL
jgi:hypothetical protein